MKNTEKLMAYCALGILFSMSITYLGELTNNKTVGKIGAMGTVATVPTAIAIGFMCSNKQRN